MAPEPAPLLRSSWFIKLLAIILVVFLGIFDSTTDCLAGQPDMEAGGPSENEVKAAYLYNFAKFVYWPETAFKDEHSPIVIGILGNDPFGAVLEETLAGKKVGGRKFEVKRFKWVQDLERCNILYISSSEKQDLEKILEKIKGWGVLTVSDTEGFAERGVILNLVKKLDKIRFKVNMDAAKDSRIKISSTLLQLTRIVTAQSMDGDK